MGTVEQLSLFELAAGPAVGPALAVCCMDGLTAKAEPSESWMRRLVPDGEYFVLVAGHPMVLRPAQRPAEGIPAGHDYYHYTIGERLFSGVFVGRCAKC